MTESHKGEGIIPNDLVFYHYFYFLCERMNMFWRKCEPYSRIWTKDPILRTYKFTNVYRACDRVSQYLIRKVIYSDLDRFLPEDVILRILVFKIFNKIDTWEFIRESYGEIRVDNFDVKRLSSLLSSRQKSWPIFSNAYMMTGSHRAYDNYASKHEKWLWMVKKEIVETGKISEILNAGSLEEIYEILRGCSFIGEFLAYQYSVDINYSPYINFDENSFVKAGIGAIRGIKKCFIEYGETYEDAIRYTYDNFDILLRKYGFEEFKPLPGRRPKLIDLQNCFCETDKYLRAKMPELVVDNVRIKQKYKEASEPIAFFFPPKWNIKVKLKSRCMQKVIPELIPF